MENFKKMMFDDTVKRVAAFKKPVIHRGTFDTRRSASDLDNSALPSKVQPSQIFQSIDVTQKQGDLQAAKKPRTTTPNTSRKMHVDSLQSSAAVNSVKNHILKHSNDDDLHAFVSESGASTMVEESPSWNQVILVMACEMYLTIFSKHQNNRAGIMPIQKLVLSHSNRSTKRFAMITIRLQFWRVSAHF
jgi:hypothetical protein